MFVQRSVCAVLSVLVLGLAVVAVAEDAPADQDRKDLQGKWELVSLNLGSGDSTGCQVTLTIDGTKMTTKPAGKNPLIGDFTIDAAKAPKSITHNVTAGYAQGTKYRGVYELSGDQLKISMGPPCGNRATTFTASAGHSVSTWKRVKG